MDKVKLLINNKSIKIDRQARIYLSQLCPICNGLGIIDSARLWRLTEYHLEKINNFKINYHDIIKICKIWREDDRKR